MGTDSEQNTCRAYIADESGGYDEIVDLNTELQSAMQDFATIAADAAATVEHFSKGAWLTIRCSTLPKAMRCGNRKRFIKLAMGRYGISRNLATTMAEYTVEAGESYQETFQWLATKSFWSHL